jgi:tetratricopeptide (TPR) repeat protein
LIDRGRLADALWAAGHLGEAEAIIGEIIDKAEAAGQFRTANAAIGRLINLLMTTGRAAEGLGWIVRLKETARLGGLGRWTQLSDEAQRLQLENALGRYAEVLAAVEPLRAEMATLPVESAAAEAANAWNVQEGILDTGAYAALNLGRWETALALNAEILDFCKRVGHRRWRSHASASTTTSPLIRLGRYNEAAAMLDGCRRVFDAENAIPQLGLVYGALADLSAERGHYEQAIRYQSIALRYFYRVGDLYHCSISHNNLSYSIYRAGGTVTSDLAHRLATSIIRVQTQDGLLQTTLGNLAMVFREFAPLRPPFPASFDALCDIVEQTEGVHFRELFDQLPKRFETGDAAMAAVIAAAEEMAKNQS